MSNLSDLLTVALFDMSDLSDLLTVALFVMSDLSDSLTLLIKKGNEQIALFLLTNFFLTYIKI